MTIEKLADIPTSDLSWSISSIIGAAIILKGGTIDSHGDPIGWFDYYKMGKQISTGKMIIEKITS